MKFGRDYSGSSCSASLLKQGHPRAQICVQRVLKYGQWWGLPSPSGQPVPCTATCTVKNFLLMLRWNLLRIDRFLLSTSCLLLGIKWSLVHPLGILPSDTYRYWWGSLSVTSCQGGEAQLLQPFLIRERLQSLDHLQRPQQNPVQELHVSLVLWWYMSWSSLEELINAASACGCCASDLSSSPWKLCQGASRATIPAAAVTSRPECFQRAATKKDTEHTALP